MYGFLDVNAWERYFYNETVYDEIPQGEEEKQQRIILGCDLDTADGRREFESKISKIVEDFPGMITREGEKFNFKAFYAQRAVLFNLDTTKYDQALVDQARRKIEQKSQQMKQLTLGESDEGEKQAVNKNIIGQRMPRRIVEDDRKAFMN